MDDINNFVSKMKILFSWMGHTDLKAFFPHADIKYQKEITDIMHGNFIPVKGDGPVKTLLSKEKYDQVHLLSDYSEDLSNAYISWLEESKIELHLTPLKNPTDYGEIYIAVNTVMDSVIKKKKKNNDISILLSPGTPAMAAIWVIISKTKYPATFWQTNMGEAWTTQIPFDLSMDIVPELLKNSDNIFHHLTARSPGEVKGFEGITGNSHAIRLAVGRAEKAAVRDVTVLITGESGTGKELFARAIRQASQRRDKPFEIINCAAIPSALLESELFGYAKGAFTGATKDKYGAFKRADGGILFLDEVGECAPDIQAKLLRVLQPPPGKSMSHREFLPVGGSKTVVSNVRIIAATNRNLVEMFKDNQFREDLYYRLAMITIKLPALRERKEDIPALAQVLLKQINEEFSSQEKAYKHKKFSTSTNNFIKRYDWPGNTRELYNSILQAVVMSDNEIIQPEEIQATLGKYQARNDNILDKPLGNGFSIDVLLKSIQKIYIEKALKEAGGIKNKAAALLGMKSYQTLDHQIKKLDIKLPKV